MRAGALALALLAGACGGSRYGFDLPARACRPADDDARPWESRGYGMVVPEDAPRRGAARPRVVIQAFSDFECPYCAQAAPTLDRLLEEYGDCLQIVWRHRPLAQHPNSRLAARAAHEIYRQRGDAAFFRYHDRLLADQAHLARADLERHAAAIEGVDLDGLRAALDGDAHVDVLARDRDAIEGLRVEPPLGAPTFFVNGYLVHGARRHAHFAYRVEQALADAYGVAHD